MLQNHTTVQTNTRAFSLVELSIVLVILGLLVGGVLSGQSLIRAAQLRAISEEYNKFITAQNTFRDKYFAIPGDMTNATAFWGVRAGSGSDTTCYDNRAGGTGTCNGNGDGLMTDNGVSVTCPERFLYWQHLADAGMIEGNFTGATNTAALCYFGPTNTPQSKYGNGGEWSIQVEPASISGDAHYFDGNYNWDAYYLVGQSGNNVISPQDLWNVDTKMDDGKPATGILYTFKGSSPLAPGCATTDVVSTAAYDLTNSNPVCLPRIRIK